MPDWVQILARIGDVRRDTSAVAISIDSKTPRKTPRGGFGPRTRQGRHPCREGDRRDSVFRARALAPRCALPGFATPSLRPNTRRSAWRTECAPLGDVMPRGTYRPRGGRTRRPRIEAARNRRRVLQRGARADTCADSRPLLDSPRSAPRSPSSHMRVEPIALGRVLDSIRQVHVRQLIAWTTRCIK